MAENESLDVVRRSAKEVCTVEKCSNRVFKVHRQTVTIDVKELHSTVSIDKIIRASEVQQTSEKIMSSNISVRNNFNVQIQEQQSADKEEHLKENAINETVTHR